MFSQRYVHLYTSQKKTGTQFTPLNKNRDLSQNVNPIHLPPWRKVSTKWGDVPECSQWSRAWVPQFCDCHLSRVKTTNISGFIGVFLHWFGLNLSIKCWLMFFGTRSDKWCQENSLETRFRWRIVGRFDSGCSNGCGKPEALMTTLIRKRKGNRGYTWYTWSGRQPPTPTAAAKATTTVLQQPSKSTSPGSEALPRTPPFTKLIRNLTIYICLRLLPKLMAFEQDPVYPLCNDLRIEYQQKPSIPGYLYPNLRVSQTYASKPLTLLYTKMPNLQASTIREAQRRMPIFSIA